MKSMNENKEASIIALAWPRTRVRRIGVWYDQVTRWLGFITGDYYKAGHAAAVLVDHSNGALQYFDFGRYHTPEKMGRLRSEKTDPELKLETRAIWGGDGEIVNIGELLSEIARHSATHGDGVMYASVIPGIDLLNALRFADDLQREGLVHYGPFDLRGTNCSRFVRDIIRNSVQNAKTKIRLSLPWMITPATKWTILNASQNGEYFEIRGDVILHLQLSIVKRLEGLFQIITNKNKLRPALVKQVGYVQNTCTDGTC